MKSKQDKACTIYVCGIVSIPVLTICAFTVGLILGFSLQTIGATVVRYGLATWVAWIFIGSLVVLFTYRFTVSHDARRDD